MLAGHNRMKAARTVGLDRIPAVVKEGLTEEESRIYLLESNVIQRSFSELLPTERAAVLKARIDELISKDKRARIVKEIARLQGVTPSGAFIYGIYNHKYDTIGMDYGISARSVMRYLRLNYLNPYWKDAVDGKRVSLKVAQEFSYLNPDEQKMLQEIVVEKKLHFSVEQAKVIREKAGTLSEKFVLSLFEDRAQIEWLQQVKGKYFKKATDEHMREVMITALEDYLAKEEVHV